MGNVDYTGGSVNEHHEMDFKVDDHSTRLHWLEAKMNIKTKTIKLSENTSRVKQGRLHMVKEVTKNKHWQIDYIKIKTLWHSQN